MFLRYLSYLEGRIHPLKCGRSGRGTSTGMGSVGVHDDVGVVGFPNEKLHEEPAGPELLVSHVVQARIRVPKGRIFMQNCVRKAECSLTWRSQQQAVACCPTHSCS